MTSPDETVERLKRRRREVPVLLLLVLGVVLLAVSGVILYMVATVKADDAEAAVGQAQGLADVAGPVCSRGTQDADLLAVCAKAAEVRLDPVAAAAADVDYERVRAIVSSAVAADPRLQPGALVGVVRQVFEANRPADGRTPSDEQLLGLIQRVFAANPPAAGVDGTDGSAGVDGANGQDGKDGAPGADGKAGPQGVSVREMRFARDGERCELLVTLFDPATGATPTSAVAVPDQLCGPVAVPPPVPPVLVPLLGR